VTVTRGVSFPTNIRANLVHSDSAALMAVSIDGPGRRICHLDYNISLLRWLCRIVPQLRFERHNGFVGIVVPEAYAEKGFHVIPITRSLEQRELEAVLRYLSECAAYLDIADVEMRLLAWFDVYARRNLN
jgi:hypothetical protein